MPCSKKRTRPILESPFTWSTWPKRGTGIDTQTWTRASRGFWTMSGLTLFTLDISTTSRRLSSLEPVTERYPGAIPVQKLRPQHVQKIYDWACSKSPDHSPHTPYTKLSAEPWRSVGYANTERFVGYFTTQAAAKAAPNVGHTNHP